jgi:integrase/recombinase XerD
MGQRRNYCADTTRGYIHAVKEFAEYFGKSPELMGAEEVREFQLYMIRDKKLALGTVALRMGALRFLYKKTLRRRDIDIDDLPLLRAPSPDISPVMKPASRVEGSSGKRMLGLGGP